MKFIILLVCLTAYVQAASVRSREHIESLTAEHVDFINSLNTTWEAAHNFKGYTIDELKGLCGTILPADFNVSYSKPETDEYKDLPEHFDSREQWPECAEVISHIRDQGSCGSCWAVSVASAITDRVCIATEGKNKTQLSAQILTSCCASCSITEGCQGGFPAVAWAYWVKLGLVSGGDYGDKETCAPYLIAPCEHHVDGLRRRCGDILKTPKCSKKCTNEQIEYGSDKSFGKMSSEISRNVGEIKTELAKRGPMSASFIVYDDFLLYKKGIYQVTEGAKELGGHAVVLIGWGKTDGIEYWLLKNNWNTDWGDRGYFKIKMGSAGINEGLAFGVAKV